MDWYDDQPPYSMIGVQTTLPVDQNKRYPPSRPIGFIWPKDKKIKNKNLKTKHGRSARKSKRR